MNFRTELYRFLVLALLWVAGAGALQAQGWERVLNISKFNSEGRAIQQTADGGYLIATETGSDSLYLVKLNPDGDIQWTRRHIVREGAYIKAMAPTPDGGFILTGNTRLNDEFAVLLVRINAKGDTLWAKWFNFGDALKKEESGNNVIVAPDGGFVVTGYVTNAGSGRDLLLLKTTPAGVLQWQRAFDEASKQEEGNGVVRTPNGYLAVGHTNVDDQQVYFVRTDENGTLLKKDMKGWPGVSDIGKSIVSIGNDTYVVAATTNSSLRLLKIKADTGITELASRTYSTLQLDVVSNLVLLPDGNVAVSGSNIVNSTNDVFILKTTVNGDSLWRKDFNNLVDDVAYSLSPTSDGGLVVSGHTGTINQDYEVYVIKTDGNGKLLSNYLTGTVYNDLNIDCARGNNEPGLGGWILKAVKGQQTYYATTDSNGRYAFLVDTGTYNLSLEVPSAYWDVCQGNYKVSFQKPKTTLTLEFAAAKFIECPQLEVDVSTAVLRPCKENTYTVRYCNSGTKPAAGAYVEVDFDKQLQPTGSSVPWVSQNGTVYRFNIGDVAPGMCGQFTVRTLLDCSALAGQTHCVKAHIYPDSICLPAKPEWDKASIVVEGSCQGDSVVFRLRNAGKAPYQQKTVQQERYKIVEDLVIFRQVPIPSLGIGQAIEVKLPANGSTYRMLADQSAGHPGESHPTVAIEGCVKGGGSNFTRGFVTQFPEDDDDPFIAIDCQESVAQLGANIKRGYPKGYDKEHYIENTTILEYLLHFQNTSGDTVKQWVLTDTLSPYLDPATVKAGSSSHPYRWEVFGNGIVRFVFDQSALPDSSVNPAASEGYVKFQVSQKPNNPKGTVIYNKATAYYDYSAPQTTNTTTHVIGDNFIQVITQVNEPTTAPAQVRIYPNPVAETANFEIEGLRFSQGELRLHDLTGRLVFMRLFNTSFFQIPKTDLPTGLYVFEIRADGRLVSSGKVVIQ